MSDIRVTEDHIDAMVKSLTFKFARVEDTATTACWAFLPNGWQLAYGESACVDPANYVKATGEYWAKARCLTNARNKLWELEGYLLKVTGKVSDGTV